MKPAPLLALYCKSEADSFHGRLWASWHFMQLPYDCHVTFVGADGKSILEYTALSWTFVSSDGELCAFML